MIDEVAGGSAVSDGDREVGSAAAKPYFAFHVFVCTNRRPDGHARGSCAARGSERLRDYMKARTKELGVASARINMAGCLDRCELGPCIVVYPQGIWYRVQTTDDVDRVLAEHLLGGRPPSDLMLP
jgi:(2Fe-2S) ferredoxin